MSWIKKGLELCEKATPGPWIHSADGWLKAIYTNGGLTRFSDVFTQHCPSVRNVEFAIDARTNYPRALKLLAEFKPLAEGLIPIAEDVLKLPKLNTEGARLGLEHLKQLLSEMESEV